jgi:hypothetical protein
MATILYGNGINRLHPDAPSWENMLKKLETKSNASLNAGIPPTIQYDKIEIISPRPSNILLKDMCETIKGPWQNPIYARLSQLHGVNFLTTNYDHTLESYFSSFLKSYKQETVYNIFSYMATTNEPQDSKFNRCNIWHIHGDVNRPKSIILGYDHYCKEIAEIRKYMPSDFRNIARANVSSSKSLQSLSLSGESWIDLIFKDDIFIIGLGLGFAELDLWWLLDIWSRLKRMGIVYNKIYYYDAILQDNIDNIDNSKESFKDTLSCFGIEYIAYKFPTYMEAYDMCMSDIENKLSNPS